tara:strand:+ start:109 stop:786 length:678 start_codon:yes stop_codon:yes gene_type:complete
MSKLPIIYNRNFQANTLLDKINIFKEFLKFQPFIILARPNKLVYEDESEKIKFIQKLKFIIDKGCINIEIPWEDNANWLDLMSDLKSNFPNIQIGSASLLNKKSIDDSLKVGLNFSMMRFWQKDLYIYSKKNNYLLVPGLTNFKQFKDAIACNCKIIKIFPIIDKDISLDIDKYKEITFIAAGGIAIKDLEKFKLLNFKGIVIGGKGYDGDKFDHEIFKYLNKIK